MTRGFVEKDGGGRGGVERFDSAGHGNADARVSAALDFFGKSGTFVADEQCHRFAPIHFPRGKKRLLSVPRLVRARSEGANSRYLELSEQDRKRGSGKNRKMKRSSRGGAQSFWRKGAGRSADAGSGGGGTGDAKGGGRAQDGADVSGILNAGENDKKWSSAGSRGVKDVVEGKCSGFDEGGDSLGMFGVGDALEEAVGCVEDWEGDFGAIEILSETSVMTAAGLGKENGFDAAAGS